MVDAPPPLVRPVQGVISAPFSYSRATPFVAGQRRVLRIAPAERQSVRAACAGPVRFAGRAPGTIAVTLRCGAWAVTVSGLEGVRVRRGQSVRRGAIVGQAGSSPVALGVRRAGDPFGYVDPEPLLRDPPAARRPVPVARAPRPRVPAVVPAPRPQILELAPTADTRPAVPLLAWIGLGLAALGLPVGVQGRRRARARATRPSAVTLLGAERSGARR